MEIEFEVLKVPIYRKKYLKFEILGFEGKRKDSFDSDLSELSYRRERKGTYFKRLSIVRKDMETSKRPKKDLKPQKGHGNVKQ